MLFRLPLNLIPQPLRVLRIQFFRRIRHLRTFLVSALLLSIQKITSARMPVTTNIGMNILD